MNEEWSRFIASNNNQLKRIYEEGNSNLEALKKEVDKHLENTFTEEEWEVYGNKKSYEFWRQLKNKEWDKYNIHYEVGILKGEPTYGFILPEKLTLTLDIENKKVRKYIQTNNNLPFDEIKVQNEIAIENIDYTNELAVPQSLDKIIQKLREWDTNHRGEINRIVRGCN